jgi:murein DD-endopeptidase MepM/ murein hydrolase activator NlpD
MRRVILAGITAVVALPVGLAATAVGPIGDQAWGFDASQLGGVIPAHILDAYLDAAETWKVDWALLAAIGKLECDHARSPAPGCNPPGTVNAAGARGPMQFLGSTWRASAGRHDRNVSGPPVPDGHGYATDGDGDGTADPWSVYDAAHAAARYLIDLGASSNPRLAAKGYNAGPDNPDATAGEAYAALAMELVGQYHQQAGIGGPGSPTATVVADGYALPFEPSGLLAVTSERRPPRDPEWQLVKPHHSGRVGADIALPVGTPLYALFEGTVTYAGPAGKCGFGVIVHGDDQRASATYCHLSSLAVATGESVTAGRLVGRSGGMPGAPGSGNSTGAHLHLHITTATGRRCPQALLLGLWRGWPVPTIAALRTHGCTYDGNPPPPQWPVPIPPELPIPDESP